MPLAFAYSPDTANAISRDARAEWIRASLAINRDAHTVNRQSAQGTIQSVMMEGQYGD